MDYHGFLWISKLFYDFHGFEKFWGQNAQHPVPPCGGLWHPEMFCGSGLDPPNIEISDSGGLDLEAWTPGCWMLEGLEWIGMDWTR